jgi:hypothetical protein
MGGGGGGGGGRQEFKLLLDFSMQQCQATRFIRVKKKFRDYILSVFLLSVRVIANAVYLVASIQPFWKF